MNKIAFKGFPIIEDMRDGNMFYTVKFDGDRILSVTSKNRKTKEQDHYKTTVTKFINDREVNYPRIYSRA